MPWDVRTAEVHYRHEFRAADGTGQLTAHVFSAQGRTGWIVAEGCDLVAGAIVPGGNPTAWKTAREAADAAMAVWQDSMRSLRAALAPIEIEDDPTDGEIDELKADILRGWVEKYGAEGVADRLATILPGITPEMAADCMLPPLVRVGDLTDEQITEAAAYAAWADTFGPRDDEPAPDFTAYISDLDRAKRRANP